jgi:hypothetical protein
MPLLAMARFGRIVGDGSAPPGGALIPAGAPTIAVQQEQVRIAPIREIVPVIQTMEVGAMMAAGLVLDELSVRQRGALVWQVAFSLGHHVAGLLPAPLAAKPTGKSSSPAAIAPASSGPRPAVAARARPRTRLTAGPVRARSGRGRGRAENRIRPSTSPW